MITAVSADHNLRLRRRNYGMFAGFRELLKLIKTLFNRNLGEGLSYSKSALAGILAGLLCGIVVGLLYVTIFSQFISELIDEISELMSSTYDVPYELIHNQLSQVISVVNLIAPIAYAIQYALLGALFGLLQHYLMLKLEISISKSIILTGVIYVLLLGIIPLLAVSALGDPVLTLILREFGSLIYVYSALPGVIFTSFLYLIHLVRGPWRGILEAKPREV